MWTSSSKKNNNTMKNMSSLSRVTLLPDSRSEHTGIDVEHLNQINKGLTPYEAPYFDIVG
ncbi:hypothetical protein BatF92_17790 [Bacteroides thetaiotaomicron]|uniref:Uncharacterized protein n=1 Tax=Bacteroides thetaiotaomicron TaxID=818 RepID=A0A679HI38_BACT4|nr:hypothetical protein BatF92_17790 [Bacteroides thetaiotaomicron]